MTLERATCGHFAAFAVDGAVLARICTCPGLAQERTRATVQRKESRLIPCEKCVAAGRHGLRPSDGPHSPHWRDGVKVDCAGEVVRG